MTSEEAVEMFKLINNAQEYLRENIRNWVVDIPLGNKIGAEPLMVAMIIIIIIIIIIT